MKRNFIKIGICTLLLSLMIGTVVLATNSIIGKDDGRIDLSTDYVLGDVNDDKTTDLLDLVRFKKYFAGLNYNINKNAANTYKDNVINSSDLVALIQILFNA